jgi:hypothetical protein
MLLLLGSRAVVDTCMATQGLLLWRLVVLLLLAVSGQPTLLRL